MTLRGKVAVTLVAVFVLLAAVVSGLQIYWVKYLLVNQTRARVDQNIRAAWRMLDAQRRQLETVVSFLGEAGPDAPAREALQHYATRWNLDILTVLDSEGLVLARASSTATGDLLPVPGLAEALEASPVVSGYTVLPDVSLEGRALLERAQAAGKSPAGLVQFAARRLPFGERVLLAGTLLNGADSLVDGIQNTIFRDEFYKNTRVGTVTIFLGPTRVATSVLLDSGARAEGTRVSEEVGRRVLEEGEPWTGRAEVVDDWYLSRYDPIRNPAGDVIGMVYVGELERVYRDIERRTVLLNIAAILGVMALAFAVSFVLGNRILRQVAALQRTTRSLAAGNLSARARIETGDEIGALAQSLNAMADHLEADRLQILEQKAAIETANRNYSEMLSFINHELRSTLGAVLFNVYLLKEGSYGELKGEQQEGIDIIEEGLKHLEELTKNYLQLSRIEKGELEVVAKNLALRKEIVVPVVNALEPQARAKRMSVEIKVPEDFTLRADPNLIRIVYDNLIENAVKYGREGGRIHVEVARADGQARLRVWNEGKGIPDEQLPHIFDRFRRYDVDESTGRRGTGLGLYIVKRIVEEHGGTITARSSPGQYAQFDIVLPQPVNLPGGRGAGEPGEMPAEI